MSDTRTHNDVVDEIRDGFGFTREFVAALTHPRTEWKEKSPLAYAFGAELEPTGRDLCPECGEPFHHDVCAPFEEEVRRVLKRTIGEYIQQTCPECHTPISNKQPVEMVESTPFVLDVSKLPTEPPETQTKTKYEPCGCLHDIGEEMIRWDVDRERLRNEHWFDGRIFDHD